MFSHGERVKIPIFILIIIMKYIMDSYMKNNNQEKYYIFIFFISALTFWGCHETSDKEFYSLLLRGSWIKIDSLKQDYTAQNLTFADSNNIKLQRNKNTFLYKYEFSFSELSIYNSDDNLINKYNIEIINKYKEMKITRIDTVSILNKELISLVGNWKRY
jgi:hypothetical protein